MLPLLFCEYQIGVHICNTRRNEVHVVKNPTGVKYGAGGQCGFQS